MRISIRITVVAIAVLAVIGVLVSQRWSASERTAALAPPDAAGTRDDARDDTEIARSAPKDDQRADAREIAMAAVDAERVPTPQPDRTTPPRAQLSVYVRELDTGRSLEGVRVRVAQSAQTHGSSPDGAPAAPLTDGAGRATLVVEAERDLQLVLRDETRQLGVTVAVPALRSGERRPIMVHLPSADDVRFFGQIVDAESGAPLAGRIVVDGIGQAPPPLATDELGRFELLARSNRVVFAFAAAPGRARARFAVSSSYADPARPLLVPLAREAVLEVTVRSASGRPLSGAVVTLAARHGVLPVAGALAMDAISGEITWRGESDANGLAIVDALPPGVPLHVTTDGYGAPTRVDPVPITLSAGERRAIEVDLGAGATVSGSLLAADGSVMALASLWLVAGEGPQPLERYEKPAQRGMTDGAGRFRFAGLAPGTWRVGTEPERSDEIVPACELVHVTDETQEIEVVLRLQRGLRFEGIVLDPSGTPVEGGHVSAFSGRAFTWGETNERGEFSIGPVAPGTWNLCADAAHGAPFARSEPRRAEAGAVGVVLTLRPAASILGEVVDAETRERRDCEVMLGSTDPLSYSIWHEPDGEVRCEQLSSGTYTVSARTRDGRIGVSEPVTVEAGRIVDGVRIELREGAQLVLRYEGAGDGVRCRILASGGLIGITQVRGATPERVVVPSGSIELRWTVNGDAAERIERLEVVAGEALESALDEGS